MVQQLTYTNAIKVFPSDYCNIPNPSLVIVSDTITSVSTNQLVCTNVDFIALGVQVGDIVYNTAAGGLVDGGATILAVVDANTLELNNDAFSTPADTFSVFAGDQNDASKSGCVLLFPIGTTPSGTITTKGGQAISLGAFTTLAFTPFVLPIQVIKYNFGGDREAIALW